MDVCQVPPGKFWELNVVRDCPKGLYRESYVRTDNKAAIKCLSCPEGWTTAGITTPALRLCNVLMPGYQPVGSGNGSSGPDSINPQANTFTPPATEACPMGFYNDAIDSLACKRCPFGSTTLRNGSTSSDDCMVPPGYYVRATAAGPVVTGIGEMVQCPTTNESEAVPGDGYYRSGWRAYKEVTSSAGDGKDVCSKCGAGIFSKAVEVDELPGSPEDSRVAATAASCYIKAGWGITFDPVSITSFKAIRPCPANTYGVANDTFGLISAPCKACTKNLYSLAGSTSFDDCKNPGGGFGYTSEGANQCPDGFWAEKDSMNPCTPCPEGRTTHYVPGNGTYQDSIEDCFLLPGFGVYSANASNPWAPGNSSGYAGRACPVGCYAPGEAAGSTTQNPTCNACPNNTSTSAAGSSSCDACAPGYGKPESSTDCTECPFGSYQFGSSDSCSACPWTTYNDPMGDGYSSYGITFTTGLKGPESCVPRYAQLPNPAGDRMALPDGMFTATVDVSGASSDNAAVKACIEACPAASCCVTEMAKDESTGTVSCKQAHLAPIAPRTDDSKAKLFYKLPPSAISAASINAPDKDSDKPDHQASDIRVKTMSAGIFAVCDIGAWSSEAAAGLVGTSPNPLLVEAGRNAIEWNAADCHDLESCKQACVANAPCWGFVWHPSAADGQPGFALRGGEMFLGGRTFFVSPDGNKATVGELHTWDTSVSGPDSPSICPAIPSTTPQQDAGSADPLTPPPQPVADPGCSGNPPAALIPNALWSCSSTASGSSCTTTTCTAGSTASGSLTATCSAGTWGSPSGRCIVAPFCPNVPPPATSCYTRIRPKVYPIVGTNTVINLAEVQLFDASGVQLLDASGVQLPRSSIDITLSTELKWSNTYLPPPNYLLLNGSYCNDGNTSTAQLLNATTVNFGPGQLCHTATLPYNGFWDPCPLLTATYPCSVGRLSRVLVWNRQDSALAPCSGTCRSRIDNFVMDVVMDDQLVSSYSFANGSSTAVFSVTVPAA